MFQSEHRFFHIELVLNVPANTSAPPGIDFSKEAMMTTYWKRKTRVLGPFLMICALGGPVVGCGGAEPQGQSSATVSAGVQHHPGCFKPEGKRGEDRS